jgi:hypothetical protein
MLVQFPLGHRLWQVEVALATAIFRDCGKKAVKVVNSHSLKH